MRLRIDEAMTSAKNKGINHDGTTGLAELLELSIPAASRFRRGKTKYIQPEWILKMMDLYKCTADQLFGQK
jgi:hypothetical protein